MLSRNFSYKLLYSAPVGNVDVFAGNVFLIDEGQEQVTNIDFDTKNNIVLFKSQLWYYNKRRTLYMTYLSKFRLCNKKVELSGKFSKSMISVISELALLHKGHISKYLYDLYSYDPAKFPFLPLCENLYSCREFVESYLNRGNIQEAYNLLSNLDDGL